MYAVSAEPVYVLPSVPPLLSIVLPLVTCFVKDQLYALVSFAVPTSVSFVVIAAVLSLSEV